MTIEFQATTFDSARDAISHVNDRGGWAILLRGKHYVVDDVTRHRLTSCGVQFAYICEAPRPDGTWCIVTIPVND